MVKRSSLVLNYAKIHKDSYEQDWKQINPMIERSNVEIDVGNMLTDAKSS